MVSNLGAQLTKDDIMVGKILDGMLEMAAVSRACVVFCSRRVWLAGIKV